MSGKDPKAFVSVLEDVTSIGGRKINLQAAPGQLKMMGGLFQHTTGFPMCLLPSTMITPQPTVMLDPSIIKEIVDVAVSVASILTVY